TNWPLERYVASMEAFLEAGCRVLWTGTAAEGEPLNEVLHSHKDVVNTTGKLSLHQLLSLISACDGLIASSTVRCTWRLALVCHARVCMLQKRRCGRSDGTPWVRRPSGKRRPSAQRLVTWMWL
ncbi:MAG: glycosyltransferase family 9 protein, partial [Flavobacteriales bacterium]